MRNYSKTISVFSQIPKCIRRSGRHIQFLRELSGVVGHKVFSHTGQGTRGQFRTALESYIVLCRVNDLRQQDDSTIPPSKEKGAYCNAIDASWKASSPEVEKLWR